VALPSPGPEVARLLLLGGRKAIPSAWRMLGANDLPRRAQVRGAGQMGGADPRGVAAPAVDPA
jgi:hypothetical protein